MEDLTSKLTELNHAHLATRPWSVFDLAGKEKARAELEQQSAQSDFWNDNVAHNRRCAN